jgi:hypothetical protein
LERALIAFFQGSVGTHKSPFWINLTQEMNENLARWKSSVVPDLNPENVNIQEEEAKAWNWSFALSFLTVGKA